MNVVRWMQKVLLPIALSLNCAVAIRGSYSGGNNSGADDKLSSLCANQTKELKAAIISSQQWALSVQDSNGRPGPGVLRHRLTWPGSYDQCLSTQGPLHLQPITPSTASPSLDWLPRYCLASVTLQQFEGEVTRIGVCFPDGCSSADVQVYLRQKGGFQGLEELQLTVKSVDHVICQSREVHWSSATVTVVVFLCLLGAVVGFSTVYQLTVSVHLYRKDTDGSSSGPSDLANLLRSQSSTSSTASEYTMLLSRPITPRRPERARMIRVMQCFSMKAGMDRLTNPQPQGQSGMTGGHTQGQGQGQEQEAPEVLPCLHGLRALSMVWVIYGQTYYFTSKVPTANLKEAWDKARSRFYFQPVVNCFLAADTFFFVSGLLVCYLTLRQMTAQHTMFNILRFYGRRLWRIVPVYVMVMMLSMFVVPHVGSGPLWSELSVLTDHCPANWWSNLFFINNLVRSDRMCMEWTWYLANDMQFYLVSPLFICLLRYCPPMGLFLCGVAVFVSSILTGFIAAFNHLSLNSVHLNQFSSSGYMENYLIKPYCRMAPYMVGILTGYFLHKLRCQLRIHLAIKIVVWIIVTTSCCSLVFGTMAAASGDTINQSATSFYFAMSHVVWALGVAWVAILCCTENGGIVGTFLSWKGWVPFSRLSLCVYLIHPVVVVVYFLTLPAPFFISAFTVGFTFIGNMAISFASALVIYLGFESPLMALKDLICRR